MSQEKLAQHLGVKFQQIQKYEKGISRISASRLHQVAVALELPLSFFLPGPKIGEEANDGDTISELRYAMEFLNSSEGLELNTLFSQIRDDRLRRRVLELVRSIAEGTK